VPIILDRGAPEDLRTMLATIASSSITVLALVLSLTLVTISLAGTQFGPRLVRMFLQSRSLKLVVSLYAGLFVYAIMVLDSLNTSEVPSRRLIPDVGATVSLVVAVAAVMALIWSVHDIAWSLQMARLVSVIAESLDNTVAALKTEISHAAPVAILSTWRPNGSGSDRPWSRACPWCPRSPGTSSRSSMRR